MTIERWDDLEFWSSKEWETIQERLDDLDKRKKNYCPNRELLFRALDLSPLCSVRACIMGQDPYPDPQYACGLAFSVPRKCTTLPASLRNIYKEYKKDLGFDAGPKHGDLSGWASQGVLLWNAVPTCEAYIPGSHRNWIEWDKLTQEIVQVLSDRGIVFGLLGGWAREYIKFIDMDANEVVLTAHPSPRAAMSARTICAFEGSRFFSTMNVKLRGMKLEPIEWRVT